MSTTNIHPLTDVGARMKYTELGDGAKYHDNVENGTNRIAAELGSMSSRDAFAEYCRDVREAHPGRKNEGYELRISWSPDELSVDKEDDVQQAIDLAYLVCKEVAPNSHYWLTAHTDGDGKCVHVHACICNHDELTGKALSRGMVYKCVAPINDDISRQWNMHVIGPSKDSGKTWEERRKECDSYEQVLGDKVHAARKASSDMDAFRGNLERDGVQLVERTKVDSDGVEHTGWTYKMREPGGGRMRRRQAQKLCDEFTKDSTEAYFAQKQEQITAPTHVQQEEPEVHEKPYRLLDSYFLEREDVRDNLEAMDRATEKNPKLNGLVKECSDYDLVRYFDAEVDKARAEFKRAKEYRDIMRKEKAPSLTALRSVFGMMAMQTKDPVQRMFDRMMMQMMAMLAQEAIKQRQQLEQDKAERQLYAARRSMWDAEKRQKAAKKAYGELMTDDQFSQFREPVQTVTVKEPEMLDVNKEPAAPVQEPVKEPVKPKRPRQVPSNLEEIFTEDQKKTASFDDEYAGYGE